MYENPGWEEAQPADARAFLTQFISI